MSAVSMPVRCTAIHPRARGPPATMPKPNASDRKRRMKPCLSSDRDVGPFMCTSRAHSTSEGSVRIDDPLDDRGCSLFFAGMDEDFDRNVGTEEMKTGSSLEPAREDGHP